VAHGWLRYAAPAVVVALSLAALAGCDKLEFKPLALPGFTVDAPTFLKAPANAQYRAGQVQAQRGTKLLSISWQVGAAMTPEEMPAAIGVAIEQVAKGHNFQVGAAKAVTIGGQKATQLDAHSGEVKVTYVDIECGKRSVMIGIVGTSQYETMRDRVLASFRCTPVEAEEKLLGDLVPIGADDPATLAGWHYADDDHSVFSISNDKLIAVFMETTVMEKREMAKLHELIPTFFALGGATFTSDGHIETRTLPGGATRTFDRGQMTVEQGTASAVTTYWTCDDGVRLVVGLLIAEDDDQRTDAIEWAARLRCSKPGDTYAF
jgi:hypothetical protein